MKIKKLNDISWEGVSHNPEIKKKVILRNGEIPQITIFGKAVFESGQSVEEHSHETMYEVFLITKGRAEFIVNGNKQLVREGDCIVIEPNEKHSQLNNFDGPVEWLYFGIATDE